MPIFRYNDELVEVVDEFKYLGVIFHFTGSYIYAMRYRLQQARRAFAIWWRKCVAWKFQAPMALLLFKICVIPSNFLHLNNMVLVYGVLRIDLVCLKRLQ